MAQAEIELFKGTNRIALTRDFIKNEATGIRTQWIARNGFESPPAWLEEVFRDLGGGVYWGVFSILNGKFGFEDTGDSKKVQNEKRELARKTLSDTELALIFQLCIKTALSRPDFDARPGRFMGHDILYTEIFEKEDSFLNVFATEEVRVILNNGRFWELIRDMKSFINRGYSSMRIKDVLENYHEDLSIDFVPVGITFFEKEGVPNERDIFELDWLTNTQIDRYIGFVKKIDTNRNRLGISKDRIAPLVGPYAATLIDLEGEEWDKNPRFEDFDRRLKDPWLVEFINQFEIVRKIMADHLTHIGDNRGIGRFDHVVRVLDLMPDPVLMFEVVASEFRDYGELGYWVRTAKEYGLSLENYFGEKAQDLYEKYLEHLKEKDTRRRGKRR